MFDQYMYPYETHKMKGVENIESNIKNMSFSTPRLNSVNFKEASAVNQRTERINHIPMVNNGRPFSYIYPNNNKISCRTNFDSPLKLRSRSYSDCSNLLSTEKGKACNSNSESKINSSIGPSGTTVVVHVHQNILPEKVLLSKNCVYEHLNGYHNPDPEPKNVRIHKKEQPTNYSSVDSRITYNPHENTSMNKTAQVIQQKKYRNRHKSERNIKHLDHLSRSSSCADLVDCLHTERGPRRYGNVSPLKVFHSSENLSTNQQSEDVHLSREHIYEEINENVIEQSKRRQPMLKKVTFMLPRDYITREEETKYKKKIIPILFWGIAEVLVQLREKSENYRRTIAHMSCRSVQLNYTSYSLQFLGKIDTSRKGERMYLVIGAESIELRNQDGLLVANHRSTDVSVIVNNEKDPKLITYIGKCKFMGRIAIVFRFNKIKHVALLHEFFRPNTLNQSSL